MIPFLSIISSIYILIATMCIINRATRHTPFLLSCSITLMAAFSLFCLVIALGCIVTGYSDHSVLLISNIVLSAVLALIPRINMEPSVREQL